MKILSHVSLTGPRGERGWGMLPHPRPRLPVGGELFPIYIPVGKETSPSPSPNRGIPRGESGIGSPLPSLLGRKGYGRTTELRRQTSKCMFGTSTPCMTYQRMGYSAPGVFTVSSHAQFARKLFRVNWLKKGSKYSSTMHFD
jgi:hypothetical protein